MMVACMERCAASGEDARRSATAEMIAAGDEALKDIGELQPGMSVMLTDDCMDHDSDALNGCLQPGQVGTLLANDGSSKPYQVESENQKWYYKAGALKEVRQETNDLSRANSRAEMNKIVREASNLSITQTIG